IVDLNYHYIPPGILLPIIENSIEHAFVHKADNQHIKIEVKEDEQECLIITIADNGVGMNAAHQKELSKKSTGLISIEKICKQEGIALEVSGNIPSGTSIVLHFKN
ncbi:MAG: ATP-binding protein, partial [Bacteroidota bacterium]